MRILILSFLFLIYLYPFAFAAFPFMGLRTLLAVFGFLWFITNAITFHNIAKPLRLLGCLVLIMAPFSFLSILTGVVNSTYNFEFVKFAFSFILIYFAAYFLIQLLQKLNIRLNMKNLSQLVVYAVLIQSSLSFLMFFLPSFQDLIFSVVNFSELEMSKMNALIERRVLGFGRSFFSAGIYSGIGLLFLSYLIRHHAHTFKKNSWYIILFLVIFAIGMMMARTTLLGAVMALFYVFSPRLRTLNFKAVKTSFKRAGVFIGVPLVLIVLLIVSFPAFLENISGILDFGFELFINMAEGEGVKTGSTNTLMTMFKFPDNFKTWLIGDGLWNMNSGGYYMSTDVGYSRMIFYFGIFGLFSFLGYQIFLIRRAWRRSFFSFILILYVLILNVKGFAEISSILILFYLMKLEAKKIGYE